tara:strand:+ start:558 stop:746 length:189 start_codon:yes stop_codon:yes gene_type:complete
MPKYYLTADFEGVEVGRVTADVEASCISEAIAIAESGDVDWAFETQDTECTSITNIRIIGDD